MKIQDLAIIFVIIIFPISLVLSAYSQYQIQTLNTQTLYDSQLTAATHDAIKAYQINAENSTTSELANSKIRDIEASVATFKNSIMSSFRLNGYTEEELNNYIPALVYTMYDGFYIYSPFENKNYQYEEDGTPAQNNGENIYGLKPYITYSCRYVKGDIDVVITYALDNYIKVQGMIGTEYVNKGGYLIDGIIYKKQEGKVEYNGIDIKSEHLKENLFGRECSYVKVNGTKYYLLEDYIENDDGSKSDCIAYISNGKLAVQTTVPKTVTAWKILIENNDNAQQYYKDAYNFSEWFKSVGLNNLRYSDAINENNDTKIWSDNDTLIFDFNSSNNPNDNIENELSNFSQHRLAVIRHKIETNLSTAIANYNNYSGVINDFQMPKLREDEWDYITHNIALISFLQGLPIGGKVYNGYTIVTNSESEEVVIEDNIYILGDDNNYHRIGDKEIESVGQIQDGVYGTAQSAGRLNLDFKRTYITNNNASKYYYPLEKYNASYKSIVTQDEVRSYEDIFQYIDEQKNAENQILAEAFYTALGRERYSAYKESNNIHDLYSVLVIADIPYDDEANIKTIRNIANQLNETENIVAKFLFFDGSEEFRLYIKEQAENYDLILIDAHAWSTQIYSSTLLEIVNKTNLLTIGNDQKGLSIMKSGIGPFSSTSVPNITESGKNKLGNIAINSYNDAQSGMHFKDDVDVFYKAIYTGEITGEYDFIGCWKNENYKWIHSQLAFRYSEPNDMELLKLLIKNAVNTK